MLLFSVSRLKFGCTQKTKNSEYFINIYRMCRKHWAFTDLLNYFKSSVAQQCKQESSWKILCKSVKIILTFYLSKSYNSTRVPNKCDRVLPKKTPKEQIFSLLLFNLRINPNLQIKLEMLFLRIMSKY